MDSTAAIMKMIMIIIKIVIRIIIVMITMIIVVIIIIVTISIIVLMRFQGVQVDSTASRHVFRKPCSSRTVVVPGHESGSPERRL